MKKKIIKLIIVVGLVLLFYLVYLNYTGQKVPENMDDLKESVSESVKKIKETASEAILEAKESTKKIVEDKVDEKINELFEN